MRYLRVSSFLWNYLQNKHNKRKSKFFLVYQLLSGGIRKLITMAPYIKIGSTDLVGHTQEFKSAACSEEGFEGMIIGAKAMAITSLKYLLDKELRIKVKDL